MDTRTATTEDPRIIDYTALMPAVPVWKPTGGYRKGAYKPLKDLANLTKDLWADLRSIATADVVRRAHKH